MRKIFCIVIICVINFLLVNTNVEAATGIKTASGKAELAGKGAGYSITDGKTQINNTIGTLISLALSFLGVIFLILIIYGGFTWMLARGREEEAKRAMQIIQMALIGLVIVVAAYAISYLVMSNLSDMTLK